MPVVRRTHGDNKQGCPYCANQKVLAGFNDLKSNFPEIAEEAHGWDPSRTTRFSRKKFQWKCPKGHVYSMVLGNRTIQGQNCPVCSNMQTISGVNDLHTKYPEIAAEANGWDPSIMNAWSNTKKEWKCRLGHTWKTSIGARTNNDGKGTGCPYCANRKVWKGFNDIATTHPMIAAQADGWDTTKVLAGSHTKKAWVCDEGHKWSVAPVNRTNRERGCPICANRILLVGYNDLATRYPDVAAEADGWDPSKVLYGTGDMKKWVCKCGQKWSSKVADRIDHDDREGTGCPACSGKGFNPSKPSWLYLMYRPGEQQFGITNDLKRRMSTHSKNGWIKLDVAGPYDGSLIYDAERKLKKWLRANYGVLEWSNENWLKTSFEVQTLRELKRLSGIESDIF